MSIFQKGIIWFLRDKSSEKDKILVFPDSGNIKNKKAGLNK